MVALGVCVCILAVVVLVCVLAFVCTVCLSSLSVVACVLSWVEIWWVEIWEVTTTPKAAQKPFPIHVCQSETAAPRRERVGRDTRTRALKVFKAYSVRV